MVAYSFVLQATVSNLSCERKVFEEILIHRPRRRPIRMVLLLKCVYSNTVFMGYKIGKKFSF